MPGLLFRLTLRLRHTFELLLLRGASIIVRLLPRRLLLPLGRLLGRAVFSFLPWRLRILRENAAHLPVTPAADFDRRAYEHLGQHLVLALQPPSLPLPLHAPGLGALAADAERGGLILCGAHVGLWELLPRAVAPHLPAAARQHGLLVYRPLHNAAVDRWLRRRRARAAGMPLVADHGSAPALRRALARGGVVGLLSDQRPSRAAVTVDFLGRPTAFGAGVASLRRASGAPVWFVALVLDHDASGAPLLRLRLEQLAPRRDSVSPADAGETPSSDASLTQSYADALGATIAEFPAQYFWWHRRWKACPA